MQHLLPQVDKYLLLAYARAELKLIKERLKPAAKPGAHVASDGTRRIKT
jgi:hypothetical protein